MTWPALSTVPSFKAGQGEEGRVLTQLAAPVLFYQESQCFPRNHPFPGKALLMTRNHYQVTRQLWVQGKLERQIFSLYSLHQKDKEGGKECGATGAPSRWASWWDGWMCAQDQSSFS